jgi:hypothetical protein
MTGSPRLIWRPNGLAAVFAVEATMDKLKHVPLLLSYRSMTPQPPKIQLSNSAQYREGYANSVQIRINLWDFFLVFGIVNQTAPDQVSIENFQGVYLSPQQAKALLNVLQQNVSQYENTFGEIKLEPHSAGSVVQ